MKKILLLIALTSVVPYACAQDDDGILTGLDGDETKPLIDTLTYEMRAGLPMAASKIYFSDRKFTWSGFGEANYTHFDGPKDRSSEDIELYNTSLYRFVSYLAYKPQPWLILYGEIFAEFYQDQNHETDFEFFIEAFADILIHESFNVRVGTHQVQIGYVNNNDEPIQFYSVNRPEVERIIIPSQWIDLGVMTYGSIAKDLTYTFSVYQGLDPRSYNGGTWIRRGRDDAFRGGFNSAILNSQLEYHGMENTTFNVSGLWSRARDLEGTSSVRSDTWLVSSFVRNEWKNWTFMALGSVGSMGNTAGIYDLTRPMTNEGVLQDGQVMGSSVYGYYAEVGYDILPMIKGDKGSTEKKSKVKNRFYNSDQVKLPIFARIERLDTHANIDPALMNFPRFRSDLTALTVGANFNPRRNIVVKANYQFRWNSEPMPSGEFEGDRIEVGLGFIF